MEEALSSQQSAVSQKEVFSNQHSAVSENQHQNQKRFTAEDTESAEKERVRQLAEALVRRIGETCDQLDKLAEENPGLVGRVTRGAKEEKAAYLRLKARLKMADMAPRCRWVRQDGTSCGSPQMKQHIYCFAHKQMAEARTLLLLLPPPEDANAIQVGLMKIQKAMIEDTISTKKAGLLLYSMQLALTNVGQTTFGKAKDEEMVRDTVDEEDAISEEARKNQHSVFSEGQGHKPFTTEVTEENQNPFTAEDAEEGKQNQQQSQKPFTAKPLHGAGVEDREEIGASGHWDMGISENKHLPRMEANDRGLETGIKPVEWWPTPDMYRTDTPEGREAYEACLRMTAARLGTERKLIQPAITPEDPAQVHNSSLCDERLPKGPRFAGESLDADAGARSVLQTEPYAVLG
jgi:hypothetical protein